MPRKLYDWDDWFSRPRFILRKGRDYDCAQSSMAQQIRNAAAARNLLVNVRDTGTGFIVWVTRPDPVLTGT
jgi:hypothetical protein